MTSVPSKSAYPASVIRVRARSGKSLYVREAEWLDDKCKLLREMDRSGWPRKSRIARNKISGVLTGSRTVWMPPGIYIGITRNSTTLEQAMKRYKGVIAKTYNPPLTKEEKQRIKRACLNGDNIFLRCTFEDKTP